MALQPRGRPFHHRDRAPCPLAPLSQRRQLADPRSAWRCLRQGVEEAKQLGIFYGEVFKATGSKLRIMPSPFYRTCLTAQPLAEALGQQVCVNLP